MYRCIHYNIVLDLVQLDCHEIFVFSIRELPSDEMLMGILMPVMRRGDRWPARAAEATSDGIRTQRASLAPSAIHCKRRASGRSGTPRDSGGHTCTQTECPGLSEASTAATALATTPAARSCHRPTPMTLSNAGNRN